MILQKLPLKLYKDFQNRVDCKTDAFNIEETINNCLKCYNYIHSSTGYNSIYLKNIDDELVVNEVLKKEEFIFALFGNELYENIY